MPLLYLLCTTRGDIPSDLLDVTNWDDSARDQEGAFAMPSVQQLSSAKLRIVVCTCFMAAKVMSPTLLPYSEWLSSGIMF